MTTAIQRAFLTFHNSIKLDNLDENATLREKRDRVLTRLRERGLRFDNFNQGSYAMGTGVVPIDLDFDIDVGLVFRGVRPDSPLDAKRVVFDAAYGHTPQVKWCRHCIRVQYVKGGEPAFHVDLAVYWETETFFGSKLLRLAVGKQGSSADHAEWRESDPRLLVEYINNLHSGEDAKQFKRVIRYLKRWKDLNFPSTGNAAPRGIALTVLAAKHFRPQKGYGARTEADYDDLGALVQVVSGIKSDFHHLLGRPVAKLPVAPFDDTFAKMTAQQGSEFKAKLDMLAARLAIAQRTQATDGLVAAFGGDFPA